MATGSPEFLSCSRKCQIVPSCQVCTHDLSPRCFPCSSQRYYLLLFVTFLLNLFVLITFSVPEERRNDFKSVYPCTYPYVCVFSFHYHIVPTVLLGRIQLELSSQMCSFISVATCYLYWGASIFSCLCGW